MAACLELFPLTQYKKIDLIKNRSPNQGISMVMSINNLYVKWLSGDRFLEGQQPWRRKLLYVCPN